MWKSLFYPLKSALLQIGTLWIVENFSNFHKKLWKNGVIICLPLG